VRVVLVASVIPEYRVPALRLWSRTPGVSLKILTTAGGAWATARGVDASHDPELDVEVLEASVFKAPGFDMIRLPAMRSRIASYEADVVVAEPRMGLVSVLGLVTNHLRTNGRRVPVVWWMAGWRNTERPGLAVALSDLMAALVVPRAGAAACYSSVAAQRATELGLPAERVFVAQNAIDTAALSDFVDEGPRDEFDGSLKMLFVGQVLARKRLDVVLRAMAEDELSLQRSQLRVVGNGPEIESLKDLAASLGLTDRVQWYPATFDQRELARHLLWADVGVLPQAGGLMINTCMAAGVPVAVGEADGSEMDLVVEGETGWFLKLDAGEYSRWIARISCDGAPLLREMGLRAKERVERVASVEGMVATLTRACVAAVEGA
jgi:glycosyltransferase involved in cell wall biosynthesis